MIVEAVIFFLKPILLPSPLNIVLNVSNLPLLSVYLN